MSDPSKTDRSEETDRSKLEPLVTGRSARLMAEDAADQKSQSQRGSGKRKTEAQTDLDPDPIPDAPVPDAAAAKGTTAGGSAETTPPPPPPAQTGRRGGGFGRFISFSLILVLALAAAFGTMPWWYPQMPPMVQGWVPEGLRPPGVQAPRDLDARFSALQQRLATAEQNISALRQQPAVSAPDTSALERAVASLQQRLSSLEARPAPTASDSPALNNASATNVEAVTAIGDAVANQAQQLAGVTARIATVEAALGNAAELGDLSDRVETLEDRSADAATVLALADRVTQVEAAANSLVTEQTEAIGLLLSVAQLQDAVSSSRSFALELQTVQAFTGRMEDLTIETSDLAAYQMTGVPTLGTLKQRFNRLAPAVIRAGLLPEESASWVRRALDRLLSVINIRRIDDDGSAATGAVITRIEQALEDGNLNGVLAAGASLSGLPAETLSPWLDDVRALDSANRALATLTAQAIGQMNVAADMSTRTRDTRTPSSAGND